MMIMTVHFNANPIAFSIGIFNLYWYAFCYLLGFGSAFLIAYLKRKNLHLNKQDIQDWLNISIIAVILGGRLGYILFYHLDFYLKNPLKMLFIWEGGMAFHGALLGLIIATVFYFKAKKASIWQGFDVLSLAVTPGLFFGRIGNFINSELVGKPTEANWGVVFSQVDGMARHPSQLYQACSEGLLLGIILYCIMQVFKPKPGILASLFLILYGFGRFFTEFFREPDVQLGPLLFNFSLGQYLCILMCLTGLICFYIKSKPGKQKENL